MIRSESDIVHSIQNPSVVKQMNQSIVEHKGFVTRLFLVEFDGKEGPKPICTEGVGDLYSVIEDQLTRMMVRVEYSEISPSSFSITSISDYHIITCFFTCFNPTNVRGFVSQCAICIVQTSEFTKHQISFITKTVQELSKELQTITVQLKQEKDKENTPLSDNSEDNTEDSSSSNEMLSQPGNTAPLLLDKLFAEYYKQPDLLKRIIRKYKDILLNTYNHYTQHSDFINAVHPNNIISCGGCSLFNWSFKTPFSPDYNTNYEESPLHSIVDANNEFLSGDYTFFDFIHEFENSFPSVILSILSGLKIIVFSSSQYDVVRKNNLATFLSQLCIKGLSSRSDSILQVVPNENTITQLEQTSPQILLIAATTPNFRNEQSCCYFDLSKGFYGLEYKEEMRNSILNSFIEYAKLGKKYVAYKYWNVLVDYSQLTLQSFMNQTILQKLLNSPERFIIRNFQRKVEQEKIFTETGQIVRNKCLFTKELYSFVKNNNFK